MTLKSIKDDIIRAIFEGVITIDRLSDDLFYLTYLKLRQGIDDFMPDIDMESVDWATKYELANNIYLFSGAKSYKNIWDIQKNIFDEKGMKRSFAKFEELVSPIYDTYNVHWLKTEFETAYAGARQAAQWIDIKQKSKTLPYLEYQTANDERVRPSHAELDGIIKKVDDPFWDTFYPPNGFNCRCIVIQHAEAEETELTPQRIEKLGNNIDDLFTMNVGKDHYIFDSKHKYFNANTLPPKLREHFKVQRAKRFGFTQKLF